MLYPKEFLQKLDLQKNKIIHARITRLSFDEQPIEVVEGLITSGSINLDGASAVRRTCQLSMVSPEVNISQYYWTINTKFKLAIGVENHIDDNYSDIIWFEQGVYLITSFNTSYSSNSYTMNISGKDNMCLLYGEVAGSLGSSVDFGTMEYEYSPGVWKKVKMSVKDIIREMVHSYAGEPFHNIIINDLEAYGLTLQEYRFKDPMFLFRKVGSNDYTQAFISQEINVFYDGSTKTLKKLVEDKNFIFESLQEDFDSPSLQSSEIYYPSNERTETNRYTIAKIDCGETAGYTEGNLVYPGDLIANVGESITSVLDKIKNFLGNFEYFYNLEGQFVFQKQKSYTSNNWSPLTKDSEGKSYVQDLYSEDEFAYSFIGSELFTSFNNTPNILNLKNDFSVWGTRSDGKLPIHMRYALDKKPEEYNTIEVADTDLEYYNKVNNLDLKGQESIAYVAGDGYSIEEDGTINCDWRELIYRMALDYNKYNHLDDFETRVAAANPDLYPTGKTGYEQYYVDLQGFWRQLYNPIDVNALQKEYKFLINKIILLEANIEFINKNITNYSEEIKDLKEQLKDAEDWEQPGILEAINEFNDLIGKARETLKEKNSKLSQLNQKREEIEEKNITYYLWNGDISKEEITPIDDTRFGWARAIYETPETLLFWFDFMEAQGELEKFSVPALGVRAKVANDNQVKAIYYREIPNVIFQSGQSNGQQQTGYRYFKVPGALSMFSKSAQGKSAKEAIDDLLYNHSYCAESVSITSIPIYYLDTNTRIYIDDPESGIKGEYIVSKLSLQLSYNGTMNITATKAAPKLL